MDLSRTSSYDYELPKDLIAQNPAEPRDSSRLLVVDRTNGTLEHRTFYEAGKYLQSGDLLVLNDTRVLPARVRGVKKGGAAKVEIFCLRPVSDGSHVWTAMVKPGRKLPCGAQVTLNDGIDVTIGERLGDGLRSVTFPARPDVLELLHSLGETPLPHYITSSTAAPERYQTVYAKDEQENSVAAPTAGLHFTRDLLAKLGEEGIEQACVTLHVGLGTFRPVKSEDISKHIMHSEFCEIPADTAQKIADTKKRGKRVIAVGTTVVRTLESFAAVYGGIKPGMLDTKLFITPGYNFKVVDALITNFHLPKSTLLMLVSAFGGHETIMSAYKQAVNERYSFFSFGDSMLIK